MNQQATITRLLAALQASLATQQELLNLLATQPAPKPVMSRRDARQKCMNAMNAVLPPSVSNWDGWKGTFLLADAALTAMGFPEDGT